MKLKQHIQKLFGRFPKENAPKGARVQSTVLPNQPQASEDWMKDYNVGSRWILGDKPDISSISSIEVTTN